MSSSVSTDITFDNDLAVDVSGLPSTYHLDIQNIPRIRIGIDPITVEPLTIEPLDVSVRIKEIPSIRAHIPALFTLGLSVLGYELFCARLCGEAQVITEPYHPNPCEHCGQVPGQNIPVSVGAIAEVSG